LHGTANPTALRGTESHGTAQHRKSRHGTESHARAVDENDSLQRLYVKKACRPKYWGKIPNFSKIFWPARTHELPRIDANDCHFVVVTQVPNILAGTLF
jgi:hypothetical protein